MKKYLWFLMLIAALFFAGCLSTDVVAENDVVEETQIVEKVEENAYERVVIDNYKSTGDMYQQAFTEVPSRVVCMETQAAQVMLALGLEDKIVGVAKSVGDVGDKYREIFDSLTLLADDGYPSKEVVISAEPDLIVGWGSAFQETELDEVDKWVDKGVHTYLMENTVSSSVTGARTVERIYKDIENLGNIFDIKDKADILISDMKNRAKKIDDATSLLSENEKVKVLTVQMVYENEFFGRSSLDLTTNLIEKAGGISLDQDFGKQSLERIIELNPDVILIIDRIDSPASEKINSLKNNPSLDSVSAVKNNRFVSVKYVDFYGGAYETMDVIESMAKAFYPKEMKDLDIHRSESLHTEYPVTISNYDGYIESNKGAVVQQEFKKRPTRIFAISQAATELLIELGLEEDIIATAHRHSPVYEPIAEIYNGIEFVGDGSYPSKEVMISYEPDIIVGWGSLFAEEYMGSVIDWHKKGVNTYVMQNTVFGLGERKVEWILNDIENLGVIFDIQDRANELKSNIEERLAVIENKIKTVEKLEKPTVHTVQYMYENEYLPRSNTDLTSDIIRLAGGRSLDNESGKQSIEMLIDKDPDIILVVNLKNSPAVDTIDAIKNHPNLKNLKAVKNDKFLIIEHTAFYCGSMQTIDAVERLNAVIMEQ